MSASLKEFQQRLVESGLMTSADLEEFCNSLPPPDEPFTADSFARELVRCGRLTPYQAARVFEGRTKGLILGNNVILEKIGEGGMGEVFKAQHRRMKRPVVIKVLPAAATESIRSRKRFQREVEAAARLSHPNIVTAFDADETDGIHFLVMEYVDGCDLGTLLTRHGPLPVDKATACVIQAARGLQFAHAQGIIHRDIKPNNLLLDRHGVVKVLDMGLARFDNKSGAELADSLTKDNQIVGTVDYMSPEQADHSAQVDARSDIYSLGCTFYRLLTGAAPYRGSSAIKKLLAHRTDPIPSLRESRGDIPAELDAVFQRMVAKSPNDRFGSMAEVIAALEPFQGDSEFDLDDEFAVARSPGESTGMTQTVEMDSAHPPADPSAATHVGQSGDDTDSAEKTSITEKTLSDATHQVPAGHAVGIDLGTTFSAIAYLDDLGRPQTLINAEGDKVTPSVVLLEEGEAIVGKEAVKAMATDMEMVAECAKRDLGWRTYHKQLGGRHYPPEAFEAWVLNKLRIDAQRQIGPIPHAVITVPAYFDEVRRKATQDAGYIAGLEVLDIINEPTAAAVSFGFQQGFFGAEDGAGEKRNILVYDLGGGTFDVTVMEIGGSEFRALATDGDVKLGGRDWDQRLVDAIAEAFLRRHGVDPREEPNTLGRLWRECEDAKRTLSARSKTNIACDYRGHAMRIEVTRKRFEEMTRDLLDRTTFTTRQTLQAAGLTWDDIDRVLLVGGSTRMPAVVEMLRTLSGKEPDNSVSPDEAVAHGAALHAGLLLAKRAGKVPKFVIKNVNSHSLGVVATDVRTKRKRNAILIPRNTPLPVTAKRVFKTQGKGQRSILVQIIEGESASPDDCSPLGQCAVRDLPPDLPARTPIEVRFRYEENGRLRIKVHVPGADKKATHEITRDNSMSRDERNAWRQYISGLPPSELDSDKSAGHSTIQK